MKEWYRTVILVLLLMTAIGFIIWQRQADSSALLQGLRR